MPCIASALQVGTNSPYPPSDHLLWHCPKMALPDYFKRNALAASQVLSGFDEDAFRQKLEAIRIGISFGDDVARSEEGRILAEMSVRLLARLYPCMSIRSSRKGETFANSLRALALAINPVIDCNEDEADFTLV